VFTQKQADRGKEFDTTHFQNATLELYLGRFKSGSRSQIKETRATGAIRTNDCNPNMLFHFKGTQLDPRLNDLFRMIADE